MQSQTKLHSSRMRTARALTVSPSMLCLGRVYLVLEGCTWSWGVSVPGGVPGLGGGVCLVLGGVSAPGGVYLVPGGWCLLLRGEGGVCSWGCTWSFGMYLVLGGVPGLGGCVCSWGECTWSQGGGVCSCGGRGVSAPGEVYLVRYFPPLWTDTRLLTYYNAPNFVCRR